jgi:hypothetical protein
LPRHRYCEQVKIDSGVTKIPAEASIEIRTMTSIDAILPHLTFITTKIAIRQANQPYKYIF